MKIVIDGGNNVGHRLVFFVPVGIVLNRFVASIAPKYLQKYGGISMTKEQARKTVKDLRKCMKELRAYKRKHPGWKMVEVAGAHGEYIEITI